MPSRSILLALLRIACDSTHTLGTARPPRGFYMLFSQLLIFSLSVLTMLGFAGAANAQPDDTIYGTWSVAFQPVQVQGKEQGCSLIYTAVQADHAYLNGRPIAINGNISTHRFGTQMIFGLKVGIKDLTIPNATFTKPNFAYVQTRTRSTAGLRQEVREGDEGYLLVAIGLAQAMDLVVEMLSESKVTIGFNRQPKGLDVLVPVDLSVFDAVEASGSRVERRRSDAAVVGFTECLERQLEVGLREAKK